jgi:hypothetical protein
MCFDMFVESACVTKPFVESILYFGLRKRISGVWTLHKVVTMLAQRHLTETL